MLVICPDAKGLASLTGALSGHFAVLPATDPDQALLLARSHGSCRLAYCAMEHDTPAALSLAEALKKTCPDLAVVALVRQPCLPAMHQALTSGLLQGVCPLPLTPEALRAKTHALLPPPCDATDPPSRPSGILTREEVDFLLDRPAAPAQVGSRQSH